MVLSGIIRPPPDIRAVADRTALFVSKNGRAFEVKILNSAKGKTPKFAFLHATSPFHAYYEDRIRFYDEGGTDEEEKRKEEEERARKEKEEAERRALEEKEAEVAAKREAARKSRASAVDPVARSLLASRAKIEEAKKRASNSEAGGSGGDGQGQDGEGGPSAEENTTPTPTHPTGPNPPPPLSHVTLVAPANLAPLEVEVIKLTAQYVALSEQKDSADNFLRNLSLKEWANPEFAFLQPRHGNFAYFTALVDGYRSFLPGGEAYVRAQNEARMKAKKERLANLIVDDATQAPMTKDMAQECLEAAAYRAEYERDAAERRREAATEGGDGIGGAATVDWHDFVVVETIEFAVDEVVEEGLPPPTSLRLAALNKAPVEPEKIEEKEEEAPVEKEEETEESSSEEDVDMEEDEEEEGEQLKVVPIYNPKVVSTQEITGDASRTHIIDPITGKSVALADMSEHMRIQLLDPKWAEERRRFLDKQRETNFVAGADIASNISRFAQARGGLGSSEADPKAAAERRLADANFLLREQSAQAPPAGPGALPPTAKPPTFAAPPEFPAPPPPPPRPPQAMGQQPSISSEEPAAKRPKSDANQVPRVPFPVPPPNVPPPNVPPPNLPVAPNLPAPANLPVPPVLPEAPSAAVAPPPLPPSSEDQTLSESDFIATLSDPDKIPIRIRVPNDSSNSWNFNGQTIDLTVKATTKVKDLKQMLKEQLGDMPANKMQFKHSSGFVNKDALSMAHFNIGPKTLLELIPKTRGGRK